MVTRVRDTESSAEAIDLLSQAFSQFRGILVLGQPAVPGRLAYARRVEALGMTTSNGNPLRSTICL